MPEGWKIWRKGGAPVRGRRRIGWDPNEEGLLDQVGREFASVCSGGARIIPLFPGSG